jgi:hypothetical protein
MISLRLAVPTALALVGLAGCLTYFLIAPAPVSPPANPCSASGNGGPVVDRGTSAGNRYANRC